MLFYRLFLVYRFKREHSLDAITFKLLTQTCVHRPCVISMQSNEETVVFFFMVVTNMLLSDISVYDAYSFLSFIINTDINS
jgi:hypothetical protein